MANIQLKSKKYGFPTPQYPFYHLILQLEGTLPNDHSLCTVEVDGKPTRDIWVYNDGVPVPENRWQAGVSNELALRVDWSNDSSHSVEIELENSQGKRYKLTSQSTAPHWGGYWNKEWKYYSGHIVSEHSNYNRRNEPVHLQLSYYAERLTSPEDEIRVVAIDPLSGVPTEIPSQVYGVSSATTLKDETAQPSTTLQVAFLADVEEVTSKVYLVFYGNQQAKKPVYPTDLAVSGSGLGLSVENSFYRIDLHDKSGQIDGIFLKQGVNVLFDHHVEAPGPLHWNPDVYAPPRVWSHACDWDPPANYTTLSGPVFFMTKRWGPLPHYPDVLVSVSYTFYAYQPYMLMNSVTDVTEDLHVRAIRNGEIVVNLNHISDFAWKHPDGRIHTLSFEGRPKEPRRAVDIPAGSKWWSFYNQEVGCSLSAIILESTSMRRGDGPVNSEPYITMKWGPWAYCVRPLAYSFNSANPQRLVHVPASTTYSERIAFYPSRLAGGPEERYPFESIDILQDKLAVPLSVSEPQMEVDERVPPAWGTTFPYPWTYG